MVSYAQRCKSFIFTKNEIKIAFFPTITLVEQMLSTHCVLNHQHDLVRETLKNMDPTDRSHILGDLWKGCSLHKNNLMTSILSDYDHPFPDQLNEALTFFCGDYPPQSTQSKILDVIKVGADINFRQHNKTPLSHLVSSSRLEIVQWFVGLGATAPFVLFDACNGKTDSDWHKKQIEIAQFENRVQGWLESPQAAPYEPPAYRNLSTFAWLLETYQEQIHLVHPNGMNLLQWVCSEGDIEKIQLVLPYFIDDIQVKSEDGSSAYSWSTRFSIYDQYADQEIYPMQEVMDQAMQERRIFYQEFMEDWSQLGTNSGTISFSIPLFQEINAFLV